MKNPTNPTKRSTPFFVWLLKLLYEVDLIRNRLLQQCLIQESFDGIDLDICDFYKIHSSVMYGTFQQQLPITTSITTYSFVILSVPSV
jgi:hypothetical protein